MLANHPLHVICAFACTIAFGAAVRGQDVIINEVLYDPHPTLGDANDDGVVNTSQDEFVELYNNTGADLDVSGWKINDLVATRHVFPAATVIPADCVAVVFGGGSPNTINMGGAVVQVASGGFLGLNNTGDTITVLNAADIEITSMSYADGDAPDESLTLDPDVTGLAYVPHSTATGSGGTLFSVGRLVDGSTFGGCPDTTDTDGDGVLDEDDNCPNTFNPNQEDCDGDGVGDLCETDPFDDCNGNGLDDNCENDCNGNGIPDECDITSGFSDDLNGNGVPDECEVVIINEVNADPETTIGLGDANGDGVADFSDDEFVEFYNNTGAPLDVSGWTLSDNVGVRHTFDAGSIIPADCVAVIFGGGTPCVAQLGGGLIQTASSGALGLNNAGDTITIQDAANVIIASISYDGVLGGQDQSFNLDPDTLGPNYELHSSIPASGGALFSPGALVDGTAFAGCPAPPLDSDGDCFIDIEDNCPSTPNPGQEDCDGDGIGDACETVMADCNNNGLDDNCEPDCNGNGVPDDCDVDPADPDGNGFVSLDCNLNGIPDECEDCDFNGIADECDIANDPMLDCDGNGVIDFCEMLADPTLDCNLNGVLDVCDVDPLDPDGDLFVSEDCNGNGTPDECEFDCNGNDSPDDCDVTNNPGLDANGNGLIDSCELLSPPAGVLLNEIRTAEPGPDENEYVEILGPPGQSLNGLWVFVIGDGAGAGGSGVIERVYALNGTSIPADGHFLMNEPPFILAPFFQTDKLVGVDELDFDSFDNLTFVLATNFWGVVNEDLDTDDDGVLDVIKWDHVVDAVALVREQNPPTLTEWAYGAALGGADVGPTRSSGGFLVEPAHVFRCNDGPDWGIGIFDPFDPIDFYDTPGTANGDCPELGCPGDVFGVSPGVVDVEDLLAVLAAWGETGPPRPDADVAPFPVGDDIVNVQDLLQVLAGWGTCPP